MHFAELVLFFGESYQCDWKNIPQKKLQKV